jgi:hypothetical protein
MPLLLLLEQRLAGSKTPSTQIGVSDSGIDLTGLLFDPTVYWTPPSTLNLALFLHFSSALHCPGRQTA